MKEQNQGSRVTVAYQHRTCFYDTRNDQIIWINSYSGNDDQNHWTYYDGTRERKLKKTFTSFKGAERWNHLICVLSSPTKTLCCNIQKYI